MAPTQASTPAPAPAPTQAPAQGAARGAAPGNNGQAAQQAPPPPAPPVNLPPPPVDQNPPQAPPPYVPTHYNGQLPTATGEVARGLAAVPLNDQRTYAADLCTFLDNPTNDLAALNGEARCFTAIIGLPHCHKVRVVYGLGFGTAGIGQQSPLANKILALYGEGGAVGNPPVLLLDPSLRTKTRILNPTDQDVETVFTAGHTIDRATHVARNVQHEQEILCLVPIPAYLAYDGLDHDIDAAMLYERLRTCAHQGTWRDWGLALCRSCMVGAVGNKDGYKTVNGNDGNPSLESTKDTTVSWSDIVKRNVVKG